MPKPPTKIYSLDTPLAAVRGIGPKSAAELAAADLQTVADFLMWLPLRYVDRSQLVTIAAAAPGQIITIKATLLQLKNRYVGRRSMQTGKIGDETGTLNVSWFNIPYLANQLGQGQLYYFSGKLNDKGWLTQPAVEAVKADTIHTNRLVPIYSAVAGIKMGTLRRWQKHIIDHVQSVPDLLPDLAESQVSDLISSLTQLHFPDDQAAIEPARQRLALEELLLLMRHSQELKAQWQHIKTTRVTLQTHTQGGAEEPLIPELPFTLTAAQRRATHEILADLTLPHPMNRLLVGDVGSGKTAVAGIAAWQVVQSQHSAALVAPTRILAEQHAQRLASLFPDLPITLITSATAKAPAGHEIATPALIVGTHAVLSRINQLQPALIIYDEQHRFGVGQRSTRIEDSPWQPHILTMSATPIPRSLMLTIFAHLGLSTLDELPAGRIPIKTWYTPSSKRVAAWKWLAEELVASGDQAIVVCPFIDPSTTEGFEHVAAVTTTFASMHKWFTQSAPAKPTHVGWRIAMLHGRLPKAEQGKVTKALYNQEIDILVTTPIVEVGVDLPKATIIAIESAERFGLASLHQLRGRVGRAGQQAYCLVFSSSPSADSQQRLVEFSKITEGRQLAELDLQHRGAGDIFGTEQHGFDQLHFASWTNLELIKLARAVYEKITAHEASGQPWQPLLPQLLRTQPTKELTIQAN